MSSYIGLVISSMMNIAEVSVSKTFSTRFAAHAFFAFVLCAEEVWKVARYTSAAPIYFTSKDNYVDGGLLANNPSLHALTTIQTHLRSTGQSAGVSLVVSVGTGINPAQEYPNLEITNVVDYVVKNKKFMVDVVSH